MSSEGGGAEGEGGKGQRKKGGQSPQQRPVIKFTHLGEIENKHVTAKAEAGLRESLLGFAVSKTTSPF